MMWVGRFGSVARRGGKDGEIGVVVSDGGDEDGDIECKCDRNVSFPPPGNCSFGMSLLFLISASGLSLTLAQKKGKKKKKKKKKATREKWSHSLAKRSQHKIPF